MGIVITAFVKKLNGVGQSQKSVSESERDIDLILILGGEVDTGPFTEMRRADANVGDYVESFAFDDATELGLRMI